MRLLRAGVVAMVLACATPTHAQTVEGVTLGQPIPDDLPDAHGTDIQPPFQFNFWALPGGRSMSVTSDTETGEVLYIEVWRTGSEGTMPAPITGLTFGTTTRAGVLTAMGSEGMVFEERGRAAALGDIAAYFDSFDIEGGNAVVSFVTIQPLTGASEEASQDAVLDSVILGHGPYLDLIWGPNRGYLPGAEPVPDPFGANAQE